MGWTGLAFAVQAADEDESVRNGEDPADYVSRLALQKAQAAAERNPGRLVLAADTTVEDRGEILGKPADGVDAKNMLRRLRGHTHYVHTAIALIDPVSGRTVTDLCTTPVEMRRYTDVEIDRYVESGDPLDKAGAYAIQHPGFHPVNRMTGCYASVMGLPLCHVMRALRKAGYEAPSSIPLTCQDNLRYDCPVSKQILEQE